MSCRILVPLDGSAAAEAALPEVERISVGGATVHFLRIVPPLPMIPAASSAEVEKFPDQAVSYLQSLREGLPEMRGLDLLRTGEPAEAILQAAMEFNIDLIAMTTHARAGMAKWFMGSVAETVVRHAQVPVLLKRPDSPAPQSILRRILVPLDGSEESLTILAAVKRLALRTGAEVVLLHVIERGLSPLLQRGGPGAPGIPEDPEQKLLAVADRLGRSDLIYWQIIAHGDPIEEILNHANTLDADLIAMSTHARSGRERASFGSVAQEVLGSAGRTVLFQRPMVHATDLGRWRYL